MKIKKITALLSAAAMSVSMLTAIPAAAENSEKTVADMVASMTTRQKVEQMIMITFRP